MYKQASSKETTVLHELTDSEGEPENELEEKFHDCFEDMMKSLLVLTIMMNLEMRILLGDYQNPRSQQPNHSMKWSNQKFYHTFMMPKT